MSIEAVIGQRPPSGREYILGWSSSMLPGQLYKGTDMSPQKSINIPKHWSTFHSQFLSLSTGISASLGTCLVWRPRPLFLVTMHFLSHGWYTCPCTIATGCESAEQSSLCSLSSSSPTFSWGSGLISPASMVTLFCWFLGKRNLERPDVSHTSTFVALLLFPR